MLDLIHLPLNSFNKHECGMQFGPRLEHHLHFVLLLNLDDVGTSGIDVLRHYRQLKTEYQRDQFLKKLKFSFGVTEIELLIQFFDIDLEI